MVKNTTNPVPQASAAKVQPDDALRRVVQLGKVVYGAALDMCWSAAFFLLLVNHFKDSKDQGFMSKSDAREYLEKKLQEQTGVKNRMLANYVATASQISSAITDNLKLFAPTVQQLANAATAEEGATILANWYQKEKGRKIESMRQLMEALGESKPKRARVVSVTPQKAAERIGNAITAMETKAADKGKAQAAAADRAVIQTVVEKVQSKLSLVVEAIKRLTQAAELDAIIQAAQDQKKELARLSKEANKAVAERTAQFEATKARNAKHFPANGKAKGRRTKAVRATA